MNAFIDLSGQVFGDWTVVRLHERNAGRATWVCVCKCGTERRVSGSNLRAGATTNCGCARTVHGHAAKRSSEYVCWRNMRQRCLNPSWPSYRNYGGRGISVCDRWRDSFENFFADMGPKPSSELTLERIDNSRGYSPDNCKWATYSDQIHNRRSRDEVMADDLVFFGGAK